MLGDKETKEISIGMYIEARQSKDSYEGLENLPEEANLKA